MRQFYKMMAMASLGLAMALPLELEAQRRVNGNNGNGGNNGQVNADRGFGKGKNKHYGNPRHGNRQYDYYNDYSFRYGNHYRRLGKIYFFNGQVYNMKKGLFFTRHYGQWVRVDAPIGMRVSHIPRNANVVHTKRGALFHFRGTYYKQVYRGVIKVVPPPRRFRNYQQW